MDFHIFIAKEGKIVHFGMVNNVKTIVEAKQKIKQVNPTLFNIMYLVRTDDFKRARDVGV